jgi:hypothetical protein
MSYKDVKISIPLREIIAMNESVKATPEIRRRIKLKSILDRWSTCTISVEDAETELSDLLASKELGPLDVQSGKLKITSERGMAFDTMVEINGQSFDWGEKLTLIIEAGMKNRILIEGCPVNFDGPKKEQS